MTTTKYQEGQTENIGKLLFDTMWVPLTLIQLAATLEAEANVKGLNASKQIVDPKTPWHQELPFKKHQL